jgi:uncharacterized protein (TIGR03545 family)
MRNWFRWWGIFAFVGVAAVIFILWFFVVDFLIAAAVERAGTRIVGAKVEVDSADLSLFPLGMELKRLQVTRPGEPMKNAVEISRIGMRLDTGNLLRRKIIADEMSLEGVRFNTPRSSSGAVAAEAAAVRTPDEESAPAEPETELFSGLDVPDVQKILEREDLETLNRARQLQAALKNEEQQWRDRLQDLPDKQKLESYRERLKKLKASDKGGLGSLLGAGSELTQLKDDVQADVRRLEQALQSYESDLKSYEQRLDRLARAPMEDVRRLQDKYGISPRGLANLSELIFGKRLRGWVETALTWYDRLAPVIESASRESPGPKTVKPIRGRGLDVHFKEQNPLPGFLVRQARADVLLQESQLAGRITNITNEPAVLGAPMAFDFSGKDLKNFESVLLDGRLNLVDPARNSGNFGLAVRGWRLDSALLSGLEGLPLTLERGTAYLNMQTDIEPRKFTSTLRAKIEQARLSAGIEAAQADYAKLLNSALESVKQLNATATVAGTPADYRIEIASDIDRILNNAVSDWVRKQTQQFENELKQAVLAKTDAPLQSTRQSFDGFEAVGGELQERLDIGQNLTAGKLLPF